MFVTLRSFHAQAPSWQWAKSATGANAEDGNCIATDANGNVYAAGYFYSPTLVFGTYTLTNSGNYDFYIVKYDASGNILWAKSGGGLNDEVGLGIATDANGNVYATGYFYSATATFGTYTLTNAGVGDMFIVKYDGMGNEVWAKNFGGTNDENANAISINSAGDVFVSGYFRSASVTFGTYTLTNSGSDDVFIAKLDLLGNAIWAKSITGTGSDVGNGIASDANGNVFVTGFYNSPSLIVDTYTLTNAGVSDIFLAKYDGLGNVAWANSYGGIYNDKGYALATDQNGNVFLTATYFSSTITVSTYTLTNAGNYDFMVVKHNGSGAVVWAKSEGGFLDDNAYGIATDIGGNVYVTGHMHSAAIVLGTYTLSNAGTGDFYVVQYNAAGNINWALNAGGFSDDGSSAIATDAAGNIFVAGYYISAAMPFSAITLTNTGSNDMFVAKLGSTITDVKSESVFNENTILIYPNPSDGNFQIISRDQKIDEVEIYDQYGLRIYKSDISQMSKVDITINGQVSGIYFLKINAGNKLISKKIIIK